MMIIHLHQVCWWDDRKGGKPEGEINLSVSHIEPVYKTMWISSKTASEFFTASTDGTVRLNDWLYPSQDDTRCCGGISGNLTTLLKDWCWTQRSKKMMDQLKRLDTSPSPQKLIYSNNGK